MASSSLLSIAFLAALLFSSTMAHSQMRCAKYNTATGNCDAPIRNTVVSFESEAYDMTTGNGICQSAMSNPISASYSNGAACPDYAGCPSPMGTYTPGETFTVMWLARNHATPDQTPGNISLYLSPPESQTQGADATLAQFQQNKFCSAPFSSCNGQNGNMVQCYTQCTMPANTAAGIYTIWWKWAWPGHTQIYSTCADIYVNAAQTSSSPSSPAPVSTPTTPVSTPSTPVATPTPTPTPVSTPVSTPTPVPTPVATPVATPTPVSTPSTPVASSTSTSSSSSSTTCSGNTMKCLSASTYSMCNRGSWGASQNCASGSMCTPTGDYIYCVKSSSPVSSPVATPAPTPVVTPTPAPVSTPTPTPVQTPSTPSTPVTPVSGTCTLGYQQCVGTSHYQTCGNGRNGPEWAAAQQCQLGLSCHSSSTANNIYCY